MNKLQPIGTPQELEEYRLWREKKIAEARQRTKTEGDQPPHLTATDEAALDRAWEALRQEEIQSEELAA